jgi:hypothetical protein
MCVASVVGWQPIAALALQRKRSKSSLFTLRRNAKPPLLAINFLHCETTWLRMQSYGNKWWCLILTGGANAPTINCDLLMSKPRHRHRLGAKDERLTVGIQKTSICVAGQDVS